MELVSYAFAAGALATLNPCGFSLLPAALGRFLANRRRGGSAGLAVGLLMGLGVFATFAGVGALVALIGTAVGAYLPYVNSLLGVGLIALGFRSLLGRPPSLAIRGPAGREGSLAEFVLFGIAYGLASLGCTLPVFFSGGGAGPVARSGRARRAPGLRPGHGRRSGGSGLGRGDGQGGGAARTPPGRARLCLAGGRAAAPRWVLPAGFPA